MTKATLHGGPAETIWLIGGLRKRLVVAWVMDTYDGALGFGVERLSCLLFSRNRPAFSSYPLLWLVFQCASRVVFVGLGTFLLVFHADSLPILKTPQYAVIETKTVHS
jgi:hypothetical protein